MSNEHLQRNSMSPITASDARCTRAWALILITWTIVSLLTLTTSPIVWQDEVQNIDLGRTTVLEPRSPWSINWLPSDRPERSLTYLAITAQELTYRLFAPSFVGPRLLSLLGALLATSIFRALLLRHKVPPIPATCLAAAFLLDPLFVQSYRGGRVDSWAMTLVLAASWFTLISDQENATEAKAALHFFAGASVALGLFAWPSALFLLPFFAAQYTQTSRSRSTSLPFHTALVLLGALVAALACIYPVRSFLSEVVRDFLEEVMGDNHNAQLEILVTKLVSFLTTFVRSPFSLVFALAAMYFRPARPLLLATIAAVGLIFAGTVYTNRLVYLLPYQFALIACVFCPFGGRSEHPRMMRVGPLLLVCLLGWAVGVSVIARTVVAIAQRASRDHENALKIAKDALGVGPHKVYVPFQLYYAGRALDWQMYREAAQHPHSKQRLLATVDYAFLTPDEYSRLGDERIAGLGLRFCASTSVVEAPFSRLVSLVNWGSGAYGQYRLYARAALNRACQDLPRPDVPFSEENGIRK